MSSNSELDVVADASSRRLSAVQSDEPHAARSVGKRGRERVTIAINVPFPTEVTSDVCFRPADLKRLVRSAGIADHVLRYRQARALVDHHDGAFGPSALIATRLLSLGPCWVEDVHGERREIKWSDAFANAMLILRNMSRTPELLRRVDRELQALEAAVAQRRRPDAIDLTRRPVYLRTDFSFGLRAGGSVGHIAGVVNNLDRHCAAPLLISTDTIPTIRPDIETVIVRPDRSSWLYAEWGQLRFNFMLFEQIAPLLAEMAASFIYQRYSVHNFTGAKLALARGLPFVLEYNGPEVWVARNWGRPLKEEARAARIEMLNLRAADAIVVVSDPLRDELIGRGIEPDKIVVIPNGVDAERYSPAIDGQPVRARCGLEGCKVIGFIGTFGKWHGAEILVEAFAELLARRPGDRERLRLMMIGDGLMMPEVKALIEERRLAGQVILTGTVAQAEGPAHLAACDILVAPHVPNPDNSLFFGSPTKLFEYMAMGKGIVASDLGQIGQVIAHRRNGLLVEPGNVGALAGGIGELLDDTSLAARLGQAARADVCDNYLWEHHVGTLIRYLAERF